MATSIQTVGEKYEIMNDLDLFVFLGLLVEEIKERPERYSLLSDLSSTWKDAREASGPGTIDLELDRIADDPARVTQLARALSALEDRARKFGETISGDLLNKDYRVPGVRFSDFQVHHLYDILAKLRKLLHLNRE